MEYDFPRYLLAKQTIDDRAINRHVLETLRANLPVTPMRVIEVGAGMGNMLARLLSWNVLTCAEYVHVDAMAENIDFAREWIPKWATDAGMRAEMLGRNQLRIYGGTKDVVVTLEVADVLEFIERRPEPGDLLIAHAFLDLLPMPESMPGLLSLTKDLAWLTINFDGMTSFEPILDAGLDEQIEYLYHQTMDRRASGGDSRAGRHLFGHLRQAGAEVLAAGSSDWVVYGTKGKYTADEDYFLRFILHFLEDSLTGSPELDAMAFAGWLAQRRAQIERGELIYIAHQLDFLARVRSR